MGNRVCGWSVRSTGDSPAPVMGVWRGCCVWARALLPGRPSQERVVGYPAGVAPARVVSAGRGCGAEAELTWFLTPALHPALAAWMGLLVRVGTPYSVSKATWWVSGRWPSDDCPDVARPHPCRPLGRGGGWGPPTKGLSGGGGGGGPTPPVPSGLGTAAGPGAWARLNGAVVTPAGTRVTVTPGGAGLTATSTPTSVSPTPAPTGAPVET